MDRILHRRDLLQTGDGNWVHGNYIGLNLGGTGVRPNGQAGIRIQGGSSSNWIGTNGDGVADELERNVISGNTLQGVNITGTGTDQNVVAGNVIGTDATGILPLGNQDSAIWIHNGARSNRIGTNGDGVADLVERNVIAASRFSGVVIWDAGTAQNVVAGNYIGTNITGTAGLGNGNNGVWIAKGAKQNRIGTDGNGTADQFEANVIAGNQSRGIDIADVGTDNNIVAGNRIGTDATGTVALGNQDSGVWIHNGASANRVGTDGNGVADLAERNLISANTNYGVVIWDAGTNNNVVAGNYIGVDITGSSALENTRDGVRIDRGAQFNRVGTDGNAVGDDAERNLISGNAWSGVGIAGIGTDANAVAGNYVGTDATGRFALPNKQHGVAIFGGAGMNRVGTNADGIADQAERNLLSGNIWSGVAISESGTNANIVAGNYIGTDATGTSPVPNQRRGVDIYASAQLNRVGTNGDGMADDAERNIISGNAWDGVGLNGAGSDQNVVAGNYIGTDFTGVFAIPNQQHGVSIFGGGKLNRVGTNGDGIADDMERNLISANRWAGVGVSGTGTSQNVVAGNYIGTDASGTTALGNHHRGVDIYSGASANTIGTNGDGVADAAERNVISGNEWNGVGVNGSGTDQNVVAGNYIGTDWTGSSAIPNRQHGVAIFGGAKTNRVGSDGDGVSDGAQRNVISGNAWSGVGISGLGTSFNAITGNLIGTAADGSVPISNTQRGVVLFGGAQSNQIGGQTAALANTIAFNGFAGVTLVDATTIRNRIVGNSIHANRSGGIDLGANGTTHNDLDDSDSGPNGYQNFPTIDSVRSGPTTRVAGTLRSTPNTQFRIDLYASAEADPSGFGEGERYLGTSLVHTDNSGYASFEITVAATSFGEVISATATDPVGNTSEFSASLADINYAPDARDDQVETDEETTIRIDVLTNDTDDDDAIAATSLVIAEQPAHGTVTMDPATGQIHYLPAQDFVGTDSFGYSVADGSGKRSNVATVSITVHPTNDAPVALADSFSIVWNNTLEVPLDTGLLANDYDVDGDGFTAAVADPPTHGSVEISPDGSFRYVPELDFQGTDSFTYRVSDGSRTSIPATVTVAVDRIGIVSYLSSDAPLAIPDGGTLRSTITVPHSFTIVDLDVRLDVSHSFDADLGIVLISPSSRRVQLVGNAGGSGSDFNETVLDDEAGSAVTSGAAPFRGTYRPAESLGELDGEDVAGTWTLEITDHSPGDVGTLDSWSIIVQGGTPDNRPPMINQVANQSVSESQTLSIAIEATDPDRPLQTLLFSLDPGAPAGVTIDPIAGLLRWTPSELDGPATYQVVVRVTDNGSPVLSTTQQISIAVDEANRSPSLSGSGDRTIAEGTLLAVNFSASDPDLPVNAFTFTLDDGAPAGATINPVTGAFTWVPDESQGSGRYPITVRVTDDGLPALSVTTTFVVEVTDVNTAPFLEFIPDQTVDEGQHLSLPVHATDVDLPANSLLFSLEAAPAGMSIDAATGLLTWIPGELSGSQSFSVTVRLTDNGVPVMSQEQTFLVSVNELNSPPELQTIGQERVAEGVALSLPVAATDSDVPSNILTYSLDSAAPTGLAIDPNTGLLTWTPSELDGPGSYSVTVRVTDNGSPPLSTFEQFDILVDEVNRPPTLSGSTDRTVAEGTLLSVIFSATDPDSPANSVTYALEPGAPPGATINSGTGTFTWAPDELQGPGRYPITVRVTDNGSPNLSGTTTFFVDVTEVNNPPRFDFIANQNILEGQPLGLTVHATDPDLPKNDLSYSLAPGAPAGMTIDTDTGAISWTPSFTQAGVYSVTVQAADHAFNPMRDEATFSITVQNASGPVVNDVSLSIANGRATELVLGFNAALDRITAQTLSNYRLVSSAGKDDRFGTADDRWTNLASATYDESSRSVRLVPAKALKLSRSFALIVNGTAGLTDALGVSLDGNRDSVPGGDYQVMVGAELAYTDGNGDSVTLSLSKAGVLALSLDAQGNGQDLELIGTVAGRSALSGKVKRSRTGGDGVTQLATISGTAGVNRSKLNSPPFIIGNISAAIVDALLTDGTIALTSRDA